MRSRVGVLFGLLLSCSAGRAQPAARETGRNEVVVASAANLTDAFQRVGQEFEAQTGIHPVFSFASTAQLTQQIVNGAPFDVFAAADATHVRELESKGLLLRGSRAIYARGVLALWIPPNSQARIDRLEDLTGATVRFIAIAKPELAPYGQAAVETLTQLGIWDSLRSKVVYAENINAAKQFGTSNNADAVFTAYSLVLKEGGKVMRVDETLHKPIDQELGIVAGAKHLDAARKFAAFLLTGKGREALASFGYTLP